MNKNSGYFITKLAQAVEDLRDLGIDAKSDDTGNEAIHKKKKKINSLIEDKATLTALALGTAAAGGAAGLLSLDNDTRSKILDVLDTPRQWSIDQVAKIVKKYNQSNGPSMWDLASPNVYFGLPGTAAIALTSHAGMPRIQDMEAARDKFLESRKNQGVIKDLSPENVRALRKGYLDTTERVQTGVREITTGRGKHKRRIREPIFADVTRRTNFPLNDKATLRDMDTLIARYKRSRGLGGGIQRIRASRQFGDRHATWVAQTGKKNFLAGRPGLRTLVTLLPLLTTLGYTGFRATQAANKWRGDNH